MKKNKFLGIVLVLFMILSIGKFPVYATDSSDEIQPYMPVQNYDDDFLEAYQETVEFMEDNSMFVDVSLETFEEEYNQSSFSSIDQFKDAKIAELEANPPETPTNVTIQNAGANSRANGSGSDYFYNIGTTLTFQPNYNDYYIFETAKRGDIIFEANAARGHGHTAIVEGHFYSTQYGYYVRTIEAAKGENVCYGLFDASRVGPRILSLYRVNDANATQRAAAVQFCKNQIDEPYFIAEAILSNNYSDLNFFWICSQLVWAGYKNQGIDIHSTTYSYAIPGVYPKEITIYSEFVSEVNFKTRQTAVSGKFKNSLSDTAIFVDEGNNTTSLQVRYGSSSSRTQAWKSAIGNFKYSQIVDVVAGDFNGDGYDDVLVVYDGGSGTTRMFMWKGSSSGLSYYCKSWESESFTSLCILDVVVGDFYGDTKDDIAIVYQYSDNSTAIFLWKGTSTTPTLTNGGSIWSSSSFSGSSIRQIVSGKFSSTTKSDLVLLYDHGGLTTSLYQWKGATSSFTLLSNNSIGYIWRSTSFNADCVVDLVVGGFTGTNYDDLAIIYDSRNRSSSIFEWQGTSSGLYKLPSSVWSSTEFIATRMSFKITSGDYNGDGYCDIAGFYDYESSTGLFYWKGTSSGFIAPNGCVWSNTTFTASCINGDVVSGNHNNSTYDDINVIYSSDVIKLFEWKGSSTGLAFNSTVNSVIMG